jgi:hypothetical protein
MDLLMPRAAVPYDLAVLRILPSPYRVQNEFEPLLGAGVAKCERSPEIAERWPYVHVLRHTERASS